MENSIKTFFALLYFAMAGNALAMDVPKGKRERDEQNEPVYAIRTRPGFTHNDNTPARVKELIKSAKRLVIAGVDLPTLYADFQRVLAQEPKVLQADTELDEHTVVYQLARIKGAATEDDLGAMYKRSLIVKETEDQDEFAANALVSMKNQ